MSTELIYAVLPAFYRMNLGLSALWLGVIEGCAEAVASLTKLFSGYWSDRTGGRKWWMLAGYGLSTLSRPLLTLAGGGWEVLGLRSADRLGKGLRSAPRDAILSRQVPLTVRGRAFGIHRAMDNAGALMGGLLAFALLHWRIVSLTGLFWLTLIPGLAALLVILLAVREAEEEKESPAMAAVSSASWAFWRAWGVLSPTARRYLGVLAVFALGNSTDALLLARAQQQMVAGGLDPMSAAALLPLLWAWLHVVKSATTPLGGRLSDRVGRKRPLLAGWLIYALTYAGFAFWTGLAAPWVLFGIYGLYYGLVEGPERALVADLEPDRSRHGTAYGWYHTIVGLTALPASALCGGLWWKFGPAAAFLTGSALALLAALMLPWALRRSAGPAPDAG